MAKRKAAKKNARTTVSQVSPVANKVRRKSKTTIAKKHRDTNETMSQGSPVKKTKKKKIVRSKKKVAKDGTQRGLILTESVQANQWKPGQSGNPAGKPPGSIGLIAYLRQHLKEKVERGKHKGKRRGDALMEKIAVLAGTAYGAQQLKQILDRVEGPVPTKIEGGEEPVRMCFNFVKAVAPADIPAPSDADEATT